MRFIPTPLPGAWTVELEPIGDGRGSFARSFCAQEFGEHGLVTEFPQHSRSFNKTRGTLRGLHMQRPPHEEVKLVSCTRGAVYDVCVDLRPNSPTYRRWHGVELSETNGVQFYLPKGCAHGFQTLSDNAEVNYLISAFYEPSAGAGWRYDDPAFSVTWPLPASVISDKDLAWPEFQV